MNRATLLVPMLALAPLPVSLAAQEAAKASDVGRRVATATAGLGNSMGWVGLQVEGYFARERLSAFAGAGYTPAFDLYDPTGPSFAAGLRGYTAGRLHRGFLALSVSQLAVQGSFTGESRRLYGPGLEAGYQYTSPGGFTFVAGGGVGYIADAPQGESRTAGMLEFGVGYTWRRIRSDRM